MAANSPQNPTLFEQVSSEVTPEVSPLLRFLMNNARRIAAVLGVCLLAGAGYGAYSWHARNKVEEAQNALGAIIVIADHNARLSKLTEFRASAPVSIRPAVELAITQAATAAKNYTAAAEAWGELAKDPQDPLYAAALIGKAESLARAGKDAEALAVLEGAALPETSSANAMANSLIADLAEKIGDMDKAIAVCEKLVAASSINNPEETDFWRQKAASLRLKKHAAKP